MDPVLFKGNKIDANSIDSTTSLVFKIIMSTIPSKVLQHAKFMDVKGTLLSPLVIVEKLKFASTTAVAQFGDYFKDVLIPLLTKRKNNETLQMYQIRLAKAFVTLNGLMKSDDLKKVQPLTLLCFGSTINACTKTT